MKKRIIANSGDKEKFIMGLYNDSLWVNFFAHVRFWTGSFSQLESLIPKKGRILDLGCGYGIFTNYLALCSEKRIMMGIDIDEYKLKHADKGIKNAKFYIGDAMKMNLPNLDAIILHDVLHHLRSYSAQEKLLRSCKDMLKKNGALFIIEPDSKPLWKLILGRIADFLIYKGTLVYYRYKKDMLELLGMYFPSKNIQYKVLLHNPFPQMLYICQN